MELQLVGRPCGCGCGAVVTSIKKDGSYRDFIWGHNSYVMENTWSCRPDSKNARTGRWRARKIIDTGHCSLENSGECKGRVEVHHIDKDPANNSPDNIRSVCIAHHRFLESGTITFQNYKLPPFYVDGSGKRRYSKY